jgi:hypothetical protein
MKCAQAASFASTHVSVLVSQRMLPSSQTISLRRILKAVVKMKASSGLSVSDNSKGSPQTVSLSGLLNREYSEKQGREVDRNRHKEPLPGWHFLRYCLR